LFHDDTRPSPITLSPHHPVQHCLVRVATDAAAAAGADDNDDEDDDVVDVGDNFFFLSPLSASAGYTEKTTGSPTDQPRR